MFDAHQDFQQGVLVRLAGFGGDDGGEARGVAGDRGLEFEEPPLAALESLRVPPPGGRAGAGHGDLDLGAVGDRVRGECETRSGIEAFEGALVRSFDLVRHGLYPPADRITYI